MEAVLKRRQTRTKPGHGPERPATKPIHRTIGAQIVSEVRRRILIGAYPAGSQLLQDNIAAEFGISKIPLREALMQLSAEGLVDVHAHRGFQVRGMSLAEARELHDLRLMIEPKTCAEGARLARQEEYKQALAALHALNQQVASDRYDDAGELNRDFHLALTVPRLQPVATEIVRRLLILSQRYSSIHLTVPGRPQRSIEQHTAIYDAWSTGRVGEVERLLIHHIEETRDDLVELLEQA